MYYPIDENTARLSHQMMSMSDYKEGSATAGYRAAVDEAAALVERQKQKVSPFYHDKLDALLDHVEFAEKIVWSAYGRKEEQEDGTVS